MDIEFVICPTNSLVYASPTNKISIGEKIEIKNNSKNRYQN